MILVSPYRPVDNSRTIPESWPPTWAQLLSKDVLFFDICCFKIKYIQDYCKLWKILAKKKLIKII